MYPEVKAAQEEVQRAMLEFEKRRQFLISKMSANWVERVLGTEGNPNKRAALDRAHEVNHIRVARAWAGVLHMTRYVRQATLYEFSKRTLLGRMFYK